MVKVVEVVHRLLPNGSADVEGLPNWEEPPVWPPDLFAVAASIINQSGIYARPRYIAHHPASCFFDDEYRVVVETLGREWRYSGKRPDGVVALWQEILQPAFEISDPDDKPAWAAVFKLLAIADEAAHGLGFASGSTSEPLGKLVLEELTALRESGSPSKLLPYLPSSMCVRVPTTECCVQPKTRTPQVGCTIRNLSHNLALLPPANEVSTNWLFAGSEAAEGEQPLNILLVPIPYDISGNAFQTIGTTSDRRTPGFMRIEQSWLLPYGDNDKKRGEHLAREVLMPLIEAAEREVHKVHALVLPEAALSEAIANKVAENLADNTQVDVFISGAMASPVAEGAPPRNIAHAEIFINKRRVTRWQQKKHHRWRLDTRQVRKYHLGNVLGHKETWWEDIDVSKRECFFYVVRDGATLAVLICEDLARVDPVQTVVRAVGPNLVIALLMDDVQLERRWPGRYATVLGDDPGCAVLTLTSLGLIRRAQMPRMNGPRVIALWKEPNGDAHELELPAGCDALLLTLSPVRETNFTADGRSDNEESVAFSLTGVRGITAGKP